MAARLVGRGALVLALAAAAVLVLAGCTTAPGPSPSPTARTVDGLRVLTVSEVLAGRAAGVITKEQIVLGGYWSGEEYAGPLLCGTPESTPGDLEEYCSLLAFGITERDEQYLGATGPSLHPYIDSGLARAPDLWDLPTIDGQLYPPVPIVVIGHFDDLRAALCEPTFRQHCRDTLVVERVVDFDAPSVPMPSPSFSIACGPLALDPNACAGAVRGAFRSFDRTIGRVTRVALVGPEAWPTCVPGLECPRPTVVARISFDKAGVDQSLSGTMDEPMVREAWEWIPLSRLIVP